MLLTMHHHLLRMVRTTGCGLGLRKARHLTHGRGRHSRYQQNNHDRREDGTHPHVEILAANFQLQPPQELRPAASLALYSGHIAV